MSEGSLTCAGEHTSEKHICLMCGWTLKPKLPFFCYAECVGMVLQHFRKTHGEPLTWPASLAGITASTVSRIENGKVEVGLVKFASLADAVQLEPSHVLRKAEHIKRVLLKKNDVNLYYSKERLRGEWYIGTKALRGLLQTQDFWV